MGHAALLVTERLSALELSLEAHAQQMAVDAATLSRTGRLPNARPAQFAVAVGDTQLVVATPGEAQRREGDVDRGEARPQKRQR